MSKKKKKQGKTEDEKKAFVWHLEKDHKGKIIERILESSQSGFAKAHQKWLDDKRKNAARNVFKRSKKDS